MAHGSAAAGPVRATVTSRTDWDSLIDELFASVVAGAPFAIGIAVKHKGLLSTSLKLRLNARFQTPQIPDYVRKQFRVALLDRIFDVGQGLEADRGVYKVVGSDLGLPRNSLLYPFHNPENADLRGVILFGGERMEGQLERRIQAAGEILQGAGRSSPHGGVALESQDQLRARLSKLNVKRLFDYDLQSLANIVNGLEETREQLPKHLKPVFKSVSDYILKHRTKQRH